MVEIKDFVKFAKETMMEYYVKGKIKHFVVSWVSQSYSKEDLGRVSHLTLCEREIHNEKDFDKWMMRIQITPKSKILWVENGVMRDFKDVFEEIMNDEIRYTAFCIKLIKRYEIENKPYLYLCRIFDAWGIYETFEIILEGYHKWIAIRNDMVDNDISARLKLFTSRKEAEKELLLKLLGGGT